MRPHQCVGAADSTAGDATGDNGATAAGDESGKASGGGGGDVGDVGDGGTAAWAQFDNDALAYAAACAPDRSGRN